MSTTTQTSPNMTIQVTVVPTSPLEILQTRYNNYTTTITGRKNPNLQRIAYRLSRKCKNTPKLSRFSQRADDLQADIEHILATEANMAQIKTVIASFVTHYSDKESWEEDHGSMESWEEFIRGLELEEAERAEIKLLRRKMVLARELKSLKREVKMGGRVKVEK